MLLLGLRLTASGAGQAMQLLRVNGSSVRVIVAEEQPAAGYVSAPGAFPPPRFRVTSSALQIGSVTPVAAGAQPGVHFVPFKVATPAAVPLADVVAALVAAAGMPAGTLDVAQLSGNVTGYAYAGGQAMRGALEPLAAAHFFSVCDVDDKVVCVPRGGALELALGADELVRDEGQAAPLVLEARDESELPRQVTATYLNAGQDYESGQQSARRLNTASSAVDALSLPLVLSDTETMMARPATARGFAVPLRRLAIAPGAVVSVPRGDRTLRLAVRRCVLKGARIEVEAVSEAAASFTSYAVGQPATALSQGVAYLSQTLLAALDVPILRPGDDGVGFYLAAAPASGAPGWEGAQVFRAIGGASYTELATLTAAAVIGRTTTALPPWPASEQRVDPFGTVEVVLRYGSLASASEAAPHRALIGAEIVQFVSVTALGAGKYRLGQLTRGVQGTGHLAGSHAAGEQFVLLTASTLRRIDDEASTIGVAQKLKAATFGRSLVDAPEFALTNTGRRRQCLPPIGLAASLQANGDTVFTWRRAVRKYGNPRNLTAVGVEESPARSDELDIFNPANGALVRTLAVTDAESVTYTAAQAAADLGSTEFAARVDAYQINGAGRGMPGRFELSTARLGPLPSVLINCDADSNPAGRVALAYPLGQSWTLVSDFDTARVLYGARSLKGPAPFQGIARTSPAVGSLGAGDWYIGAWVYIGATVSSVDVISQWTGVGSNAFRLYLNGSVAGVMTSGDASNVLASILEPSASIVLNAWNHFAASRAGNTLRLFVNGALRASSAAATSQATPVVDLWLGYNNSPTSYVANSLQEAVFIVGSAYRTAAFVPTYPYRFR